MHLYHFISFLLLFFFQPHSSQQEHYYINFEKIDNRVDILVNDSLMYTSGTIDFNPDLTEVYSVYLGNFLTPKKDKVVVRLYNGHEPYENEEDSSWELKYVLLKNEDLVDYVWESENDGRIGVVFEMTHYL